VGTRPASAFIRRAPFQLLDHFLRDTCTGGSGHAEPAQGLEFRQLVLQILHARGRGLRFELVKHGLRGVRLHHQELIQLCEDLGGEARGDPGIEVLKKAVESGPDQAPEFTLGWQFQAEGSATGIRAFVEIVFGRGGGRPVRTQPGFEALLVLPSGKAEAGVLPNQGQVDIAGTGMPWIVGRGIPEQLELVPNECPDVQRDLLEAFGKITQIVESFQ